MAQHSEVVKMQCEPRPLSRITERTTPPSSFRPAPSFYDFPGDDNDDAQSIESVITAADGLTLARRSAYDRPCDSTPRFVPFPAGTCDTMPSSLRTAQPRGAPAYTDQAEVARHSFPARPKLRRSTIDGYISASMRGLGLGSKASTPEAESPVWIDTFPIPPRQRNFHHSTSSLPLPPFRSSSRESTRRSGLSNVLHHLLGDAPYTSGALASTSRGRANSSPRKLAKRDRAYSLSFNVADSLQVEEACPPAASRKAGIFGVQEDGRDEALAKLEGRPTFRNLESEDHVQRERAHSSGTAISEAMERVLVVRNSIEDALSLDEEEDDVGVEETLMDALQCWTEWENVSHFGSLRRSPSSRRTVTRTRRAIPTFPPAPSLQHPPDHLTLRSPVRPASAIVFPTTPDPPALEDAGAAIPLPDEAPVASPHVEGFDGEGDTALIVAKSLLVQAEALLEQAASMRQMAERMRALAEESMERALALRVADEVPTPSLDVRVDIDDRQLLTKRRESFVLPVHVPEDVMHSTSKHRKRRSWWGRCTGV